MLETVSKPAAFWGQRDPKWDTLDATRFPELASTALACCYEISKEFLLGGYRKRRHAATMYANSVLRSTKYQNVELLP